AQFNSKTIRLVIEHNQAISIKATPQGSTLYIDLSLEPPKITPPLATLPVSKPEVQEPPLIAALPPLVTVTPRDRSKKIIVIDPGHGGKDSGATGNGLMEKDIVLQIGTILAEKLRSQGYTVHMTRSNDTFIELKDRTKFANDKEADLFISIHANSIPKTSDPAAAQGLETYFLSPTRSERAMRVAASENSQDMGEMGAYGKLSFLSFLNKEKIIASNKLGIDLQKGILGNLRKQFPNVHDNGVREAPFWVLVGAQMPAVLVEVGYISNPDEAVRIANDKYQRWMVDGLVDGVSHYFANNN
ncbi:MAG: N-acetylmuramoyl-L-alanine amidase, partial [Sulfuricurvum sp.]|nr:N-acetylmuramoyl-L-alanine amidase [Sulfuricurvum sp.]